MKMRGGINCKLDTVHTTTETLPCPMLRSCPRGARERDRMKLLSDV